jgi:hypothetical protein
MTGVNDAIAKAACPDESLGLTAFVCILLGVSNGSLKKTNRN